MNTEPPRTHPLPTGWVSLAKLGKSRLLRSSYIWLLIVPVAARLLSSVPDTIDLTALSPELRLHLDVPFSWRIFYLSAVATACANLLYILFCPPLIRHYPSYSEFRASGQGEQYLLRFAQWRYRGEILTYEEGPDYNLLVALEDDTKMPIRIVCVLLYAVAAALASIVVVQNAVYVFDVFTKTRF